MRFRLRTLLIVLALGPMVIGLPVKIQKWREAYRRAQCCATGIQYSGPGDGSFNSP